MKYIFAVLAVMAVAVNAKTLKRANLGEFAFGNCNPADPITLTDLVIAPDPVLIPGTISYSGAITGTVPVQSPLVVDVTLEHKANDATDYVVLDCIDGVFGSCHFDDFCVNLATAFADGCPQGFIDAGVPCTCPFEAGTYVVPGGSFEVVDPLDVVKPGSYRATAVLTDGASGSELQCFTVNIDIQPAP